MQEILDLKGKDTVDANLHKLSNWISKEFHL